MFFRAVHRASWPWLPSGHGCRLLPPPTSFPPLSLMRNAAGLIYCQVASALILLYTDLVGSQKQRFQLISSGKQWHTPNSNCCSPGSWDVEDLSSCGWDTTHDKLIPLDGKLCSLHHRTHVSTLTSNLVFVFTSWKPCFHLVWFSLHH